MNGGQNPPVRSTFLRETFQHDLVRVRQLRRSDLAIRRPPAEDVVFPRHADQQVLRRGRSAVGQHAGGLDAPAFGVGVQAPVPCPPDESNDHDRTWPACGSQPMICTPDEVVTPSCRTVYSPLQETLVGDPADVRMDRGVFGLGLPVADQPLELLQSPDSSTEARRPIRGRWP